jgi:hypothetical protein
VVLGLALAHLVVAALFSTHVPAERLLPAALVRLLGIYGDLTGARTHFDYFAPEGAPQARAHVLLTARDGTVTRRDIRAANDEVNTRLAILMSYLGDRRVRELLMHSWCLHFLSADATLAAAEARVEIIEIPTMAEAREGRRARWLPLDRYRLTREQAS